MLGTQIRCILVIYRRYFKRTKERWLTQLCAELEVILGNCHKVRPGIEKARKDIPCSGSSMG